MAPRSRSDEEGQIRQIDRLVRSMNGTGIGFWLSGGWAVDFHVGRMTRSHSDIDFVVELRDKKTLWSLLEGEGAAHVVSDESGGVESFELDELRVEITYVMEDEKGSRVTPGFESWPWPEESSNEESVTLAGITTRVVSIAGLLDMKQVGRSTLERSRVLMISLSLKLCRQYWKTPAQPRQRIKQHLSPPATQVTVSDGLWSRWRARR
jgi:hypothetical protein